MVAQGNPEEKVKIAVITNDGDTIANHFGMAEYYKVYTSEAGKITSKEQRSKPHHSAHPDLSQSQLHDHGDMLAPIRDCHVLLCGGMRTRAYNSAEAAGLKVIMTGGLIEDAISAYLSGNLVSESRRIFNR